MLHKKNYQYMKVKKFKDNIDDFFKWVKGTELVELDDIDVSEDPVETRILCAILEYNMAVKYLV